MSTAYPMQSPRRVEGYLAQTGRAELTARQRRRCRHKSNIASSARVRSGTGRYGRLGRRFDRKDRAEIKERARRVVAFVRARKAGLR